MWPIRLRRKQVPHGKVTWQIDRNVNTTNVCIANCKFCNFTGCGHEEAYITDIDTYKENQKKPLSMGRPVACCRVAITPTGT